MKSLVCRISRLRNDLNSDQIQTTDTKRVSSNSIDGKPLVMTTKSLYFSYSKYFVRKWRECKCQSKLNRLYDQSRIGQRNPLSFIPNDLTTYVPDGQLVVEGVNRANKVFAKDSSNAVHKTIWHTRKKRDPNSSRWSENLPIFVCGGARAIDLYQQVIQGIEAWVHRFIPSCPGIRVIPLPKPTSLEANINDADYHRLAVAWGLSHESFNIGTYERPSEINDVPPPRKADISEKFISKDMV